MNGGVNKNLISTKIREFHIDWVVVLSPVIVMVIVIAVIVLQFLGVWMSDGSTPWWLRLELCLSLPLI